MKKVKFMELPVCPECGRRLGYGKVVARLPVFRVRCGCGAQIRFSPGLRTLALWLATFFLCFEMNIWLLQRVTWTLPLLCYTMLMIATAFLLSPLTKRRETVQKKK